MEILNVLLLIGALILLVVILFWGGIVVATATTFAWLLLPLIIGILAILSSIKLWRAGNDDLAVLMCLGVFVAMGLFRHFICGKEGWSDWALEHDPGSWLGDRWEHLFKSLRLISRNPLVECPKCANRQFTKVASSTFSYNTTETETHRIRHYSPDDTETGYSEIEREVPATRTVTKYVCQCKACSHTWSVAD
jgi:hypothetical protein